ncbi:MAG: type VI secretion system ATPase TssH, partial [Proteobacteria bacterium]|nr:type VI secretion system ATPase TssH [Pseudomonadota bacterium]
MIPMERFTRQAQEAMARTQAIVTQFGHATVEPEHLLLALLDNAGPVVDAVASLKADPQAIASQVRAHLGRQPRQGASGQLFLGRRGKRILDAAIF